MDIEEKIIRARYHDALSKSMEAQEELETALRVMHEIGEYPPPPKGLRFPLDDTQREGTTHTMRIGLGKDGIKGYVTTGVYSDGTLGEIFIKAEKQGSFVSGLMDSFATVFSIALQSGVPLDRLISKLRFTRFEPAGFTKNPEIRIDDGEAVEINTDDTYSFRATDAFGMSIFIDDDDIIYGVYLDHFTSLNYAYQAFRSVDFGISVERHSSWSFGNHSSDDYIHLFDYEQVGGRAQMVGRFVSTDATTYDVNSVIAVEFGGYGSHTWADGTYLDDGAGVLIQNDNYFPRNRMTWGTYQQTSYANSQAMLYMPYALPSSLGWTTAGGGTESITSAALYRIATAGNTLTNTVAVSGDPENMCAEWEIDIAAGSGSSGTDRISVKMAIGDGATYDANITIRMFDTGFEVYDVNAAANVYTQTVSLATTTRFRVALSKGGAAPVAKRAHLWYCQPGHVSEWTYSGSLTLTDGGGATTDNIDWGHLANGNDTADWSFFGWTPLAHAWGDSSYYSDLWVWSNPAALFPRVYPSRPMLVDDNIEIAAKGGPTRIGERWTCNADYKYPLSAIYPNVSPSPSKVWRSIDDDSDAWLVWDTESMYTDGVMDNNVVAMFLLNSNIKTAYLKGWTGAGWDTLGTFNAADGYESLAYIRKGRKVRPNLTETTHGTRYIFREDHVGDTFDFVTAAGDPLPNRYAKIEHNTEGVWSDNTTAKGKHPTMWIDTDYLNANTATDSKDGAIWRKDHGIVITGWPLTYLYDVFALHIPAQTTADGYFQIGSLCFGEVAVLGTQYDRGYAYKHVYPIRETTLDDGNILSTSDGDPRKQFTFAIANRWVDTTDVNADSPSPDWQTGNTNSDIPSASLGDAVRNMEGVVRRVKRSASPVLMLTRVSRQSSAATVSTVENQRRAFIWGNIRNDPQVDAPIGDEMTDECETLQLMTIEELT